MSDKPNDIAGDWSMIEAQLPPDWRKLAQQHGLDPAVVPPQLGAKVQDISVPLRLVLYHVGTNTSYGVKSRLRDFGRGRPAA